MQRYFSTNKINNNFTLLDEDIRHIKVVMRMRDNDEIIVVYNNEPYLCYIDGINKDIKIIIKNELQKYEEMIPKINIIVPILKEQKMDYIIQKSTELGVSEITPFYAERSVIKDNNSGDKKLLRWQKIAKEASEQSHRNDIPSIKTILKLEEINKLSGINLVCSTRELSRNIKNVLKTTTKCDRINLVIGPEGGLSNKEEDYLIEHGFLPITFGNRILRVETAPLFIMSVVNYEFME